MARLPRERPRPGARPGPFHLRDAPDEGARLSATDRELLIRRTPRSVGLGLRRPRVAAVFAAAGGIAQLRRRQRTVRTIRGLPWTSARLVRTIRGLGAPPSPPPLSPAQRTAKTSSVATWHSSAVAPQTSPVAPPTLR